MYFISVHDYLIFMNLKIFQERPKMLVLTLFHSLCFIFANLVIGLWYAVHMIQLQKISSAVFSLIFVFVLSGKLKSRVSL